MGEGVFQRSCSQNQSAGDARICSASLRLISAVSASMSELDGTIGSPATIFHRATPQVRIATGTSRAPVRSASVAATGEVEASRPKRGAHTPPSPECWSTITLTRPPSRRNAIGAEKPSEVGNGTTPIRARSSFMACSTCGFPSRWYTAP